MFYDHICVIEDYIADMTDGYKVFVASQISDVDWFSNNGAIIRTFNLILTLLAHLVHITMYYIVITVCGVVG